MRISDVGLHVSFREIRAKHGSYFKFSPTKISKTSELFQIFSDEIVSTTHEICRISQGNVRKHAENRREAGKMECKCRSNLIILMGISEDLLLVFRKLTLYLKIGFNIIRGAKIEKNRKSWQFSRGSTIPNLAIGVL